MEHGRIGVSRSESEEKESGKRLPYDFVKAASKKYFIDWDEIIESGVKEMSTIIEDLKQSYIDNAIEENSISLSVSYVLKLVKTYGVTVEKAIEILDIPE